MSNAKATSTVSILRQATSLGRILRGAFASRDASRRTDGRGAPSAGRLRRPALAGAAASLLAALALALAAAPALAAGDANEPFCPPETEASPGFRAYLPDCRAYELVSPPFKEGGELSQKEKTAISASGEDLVVGMIGATGGAGNLPADFQAGALGVVFHLTRTAAGWRYTALTPPATAYNHSALLAVGADPTLSATLWGAQVPSSPYHNEDIYIQSQPGGELARVGPGFVPELAGWRGIRGLTLRGASADLSHSLFSDFSETIGGHSTVWPGDTTQVGRVSLYEYAYNGSELPEPLLVGVKNSGPLASNTEAQLISACGAELGSGERHSMYNAVSRDGETVFFTANACGGSPAANELWARLGGEHSVKISEPVLPGGGAGECGGAEPCASAAPMNGEFQGADEGGHRVFFTSEQPLVNGAPAAGKKLYEERLQGGSVAEVLDLSNPPGFAGANPEVQGVSRISADGSHAYFVAKAVLAGANAEGKSPVAGAFNLYVSEPDPAHPGASRLVFVATLLTAAEESTLASEESAEATVVTRRATLAGEIAEREALARGEGFFEVFVARREAEQNTRKALTGTLGPSGTLFTDRSVWSAGDNRYAQTTPDGRFLVFPSSADPLGEGLAHLPQLYEYDAEGGAGGEGALRRVSIGQGGSYDKNGDVTTFHDAATIPRQSFETMDLPTAAQTRLALSPDGSEVFFTSAAPLAPGAVSGAPAVFEYRAGDVYLISDGRDAAKMTAGIGVPAVALYGVAAATQPAGRDVFFTTADSLVPQSGDTQQSLYDARAAGGFPAPAAAASCAGEACQGPLASAPSTETPGSASFAGPGNARQRHRRPRKHHRRHHRRAARHDRRAAK